MPHKRPIVNPKQYGCEDPGEGVAEEEIREGAVGGEDEEDPGEAGAADGEEGDDGGADAVAVAAQGGGDGVADGAEEAEGDDVLDARLREADDLGIAGEIGKDCVHGEQCEDAVEERDDDGEGEAERGGAAGEKGEQDGGVDGAGGVAQPACAERLRDEDVRTEREAEEEVDDETDERRVVADGSHGGRAVIAAEDQRVGGVEELLEDTCEHERWRRR